MADARGTDSPLLTVWNDLTARLSEASSAGSGSRSLEAGAENLDAYEGVIRRMGLDPEDVLGFARTLAGDGITDLVRAARSGNGADAFALVEGVAVFSLLAGVELERRR